MSYLEVKPQYYQMHMPDSPWHAGSKGWKSAPWPSFGVNPNLVGPPRLAVEGLGNPSAMGAYFKPVYETPISGFGDDAAPKSPDSISYSTPATFPWFTALICGTVLGVTYLRRKVYK